MAHWARRGRASSVADMMTTKPRPAPATGPRHAPAARDRSRFQSLAMVAVFDIAGPLVAYSVLRSAGQSAVTALVLSGAFPGLGVALAFVRDRRLDALGGIVLIGIVVGTVIGLVTGDARQVLLEGSVPTAIFGLVCLGSLWSRRPLIYRFAQEFMGAGTPRGRDFADGWRYPGFRRVFRVFTVVWGVAYLARSGGESRHRRDDHDGDRPGGLQGDALRRGRCPGRLDGRLRPAGPAARRAAGRRGAGRYRASGCGQPGSTAGAARTVTPAGGGERIPGPARP